MVEVSFNPLWLLLLVPFTGTVAAVSIGLYRIGVVERRLNHHSQRLDEAINCLSRIEGQLETLLNGGKGDSK